MQHQVRIAILLVLSLSFHLYSAERIISEQCLSPDGIIDDVFFGIIKQHRPSPGVYYVSPAHALYCAHKQAREIVGITLNDNQNEPIIFSPKSLAKSQKLSSRTHLNNTANKSKGPRILMQPITPPYQPIIIKPTPRLKRTPPGTSFIAQK